MEDRPNLYYEGNTVIPPAPGAKRKWRTIQQPIAWDFRHKVMPFEPKTCATSRCVWCNQNFGGRYMIVCPRCHNCQYCGLMSTNSMDACTLCGNRLPDELRTARTVFRPDPAE